MKNFLRTKKTQIVDVHNKTIRLQGVNFGGWLMMEGYILHSLNRPEQEFKKEFAKSLGEAALRNFEKSFRDAFIQSGDVKEIARCGFNCIRVPFNYRLIEKKPYRYDAEGLAFLDKVVRWARQNHIWIILDLHAAPGAQNCDWHSDSLGRAELWTKKKYQDRTYKLWEFLANRYKDEEAIAGYDLLNEAVVNNTSALNSFYRQLIKRIRKIDKNHILFIEGNNWAMDLNCLEEFDDDNLALSIHTYQPLDFTFNFIQHLSYPLRSKSSKWNKATTKKLMTRYCDIARKRQRPIFVGEFGVNYRQGVYGEDKWLEDTLKCFGEFGFSWTYWTYKAVKNSIFPDGLFSYMGNPAWVNRQGPFMGWAAYSRCWPKKCNSMISSWRTNSFKKNEKVLKVLKDAVI